MLAIQLEIVTRRNGRFVKVQDVLVEGVQIATLHKAGKTCVLTFTSPNDHLDPCTFSSRDDACAFLYDQFTSEPMVAAFSLTWWRNWEATHDRHIDNLYKSTDDYFMALNRPREVRYIEMICNNALEGA